MRGYIAAVVLLTLAGAAGATSFDGVIVASTPVTPPSDARWAIVVYLVLFAATFVFLLRRIARTSWHWALIGGVSGAALAWWLSVSAVVSSHWSQWGSTILSSSALRGEAAQGWADLSLSYSLPVMIITAATVALALALVPATHPRKAWPRWVYPVFVIFFVIVWMALSAGSTGRGEGYPHLAAINWLLYGTLGITLLAAMRAHGWAALWAIPAGIGVVCVCLIPLAATRNLVHGYAPGSECSMNVKGRIFSALVSYADSHGGSLPVVNDIHALVDTIHVADPDESADKFYGCPETLSYVGTEQPYLWNVALSGKTIHELAKMPDNTPVIACPYHRTNVLTTGELVWEYKSAAPVPY